MTCNLLLTNQVKLEEYAGRLFHLTCHGVKADALLPFRSTFASGSMCNLRPSTDNKKDRSMAAIPMTLESVGDVKRTLRSRFPNDKSSHLSEALAAALGFRTRISLAESLRRSPQDDPDYALLDEDPFLSRLAQVASRPLTANDRALIFDRLTYSEPSRVVKTRSNGWRRVEYARSGRRRAWRNAMVAAINEGIRLRLFTIKPGDNRWPSAVKDDQGRSRAHKITFELAGIPAVGSVHDGGYDELSIHLALWPTPDGARWVDCMNAGFLAGDVWASGWLERRDGAWLQVPTSPSMGSCLSCRRNRLRQAAAREVEPSGFADRGSFKF